MRLAKEAHFTQATEDKEVPGRRSIIRLVEPATHRAGAIFWRVAVGTGQTRRARFHDAFRVGFYVSLIRVIVFNLLLVTLAWSIFEFAVTRCFPHQGLLSESTVVPVILSWSARLLCYLSVVFLVALVTASLLETALGTSLTIAGSRSSSHIPLIPKARLSCEDAFYLKRVLLCRAYPRAPPMTVTSLV